MTKNKSILLVLLILSISFRIELTYASVDPNLITSIQKIIDDDRIKYQMPGVQVSIIFSGENKPHDFVSGTTVLNGDIPVQANNLFRINSETKTFIAATILLLESKNLISSVDDPIEKYLPALIPSWKKITIRQLLNHTSGLFNYDDSNEWLKIATDSNFQKQWTPEELISFAEKEPTYFSPGKGYHYSNTNYILAGMIIHAVTGQSIRKAITNHLFNPLHLLNTYYIPSSYKLTIMKRMVHGYDDDPLKDVTDINISMSGGAGSITSTTHDTAIFLHTLVKSLLLPKKQMNELMTLVSDEDGKPISVKDKNSGDGLGIGYYFDLEEDIWGHQGSGFGYSTAMIWMKCSDIIIATAVSDHKPDPSDSYTLFHDIAVFIKKSGLAKQCSPL